MPEITDAQYSEFIGFQQLGTLKEVAKKITDLEADNRKYRQEEKPALEAKVPKDGEVVVPKAKAEALEKYEALGTPEELTTSRTEAEDLRTKVAAREREDAFRGAAKAMGWPEDTVATLLDMRSLDGAAIEVKREKNERGEEVEVPYVTPSGENQKAQKFSDFAAAAPQLKGLKVEAGVQQQQRQAFHRQTGDGTPAKGTIYERIREDAKKRNEAAASGPSLEERLGKTA